MEGVVKSKCGQERQLNGQKRTCWPRGRERKEGGPEDKRERGENLSVPKRMESSIKALKQ